MSSLCCKLYSMGSTPGKSCGGSYVVADVHQATKVCRPTYKKSVCQVGDKWACKVQSLQPTL